MDSSRPPSPPAPPLPLPVASPPAITESHELRKPHEMIVLVPRSKRVTLTGRRIYNALLQVAQARLAAMAQMPPADHMFEAPLPAILRTTGSSGEDRTAAKRYLREMRGLEVDWESTAPGDGVKWKGFSMLSEVAIELRHGENWVSWSYPPTLMAALKEPTRWARIDLDMLTRLGTYAALALYEICARYRDNPSGLTSRKPVQWWADALSPTPAGAERREWRKFKNERVKEAVEEINRETDLEIELIEHRQGRAVVEAQFAVRRRRNAAQDRLAQAQAVDANLVLRAESLGIRESKLDGLMTEFGEDAVRQQLTVLERRAADSRLRGIDNGFSYLRSLLRQAAADAMADAAAGMAGMAPHGQPDAAAAPVAADPLAPRAAAHALESDPRAPTAPRPMQQPGGDGLHQADSVSFGRSPAPAANRPPARLTRRPTAPAAELQATYSAAAANALPGFSHTPGPLRLMEAWSPDRPATAPAVASPHPRDGARAAPAPAVAASATTAHDEAWLLGRMAAVKQAFAALDPVQRKPWVDQALAELGAKGLLSAVIARRAAQGDVLHGMLGSVLVRLYAEALHGPGWDNPPTP